MIIQDIGHNGKGRGSWLIMKANRGKQSHASRRFIMTDDEVRRAQVLTGYPFSNDHEIESIQFKGVHHQPFTPSPNQTWFDFDYTQEEAWKILEAMSEKLGCRYDWRGIAGFIIRMDLDNLKKWFCSELCAWGLLQAGIRSSWKKPSKLSPTEYFSSILFRVNENSPIQIEGR